MSQTWGPRHWANKPPGNVAPCKALVPLPPRRRVAQRTELVAHLREAHVSLGQLGLVLGHARAQGVHGSDLLLQRGHARHPVLVLLLKPRHALPHRARVVQHRRLARHRRLQLVGAGGSAARHVQFVLQPPAQRLRLVRALGLRAQLLLPLPQRLNGLLKAHALFAAARGCAMSHCGQA